MISRLILSLMLRRVAYITINKIIKFSLIGINLQLIVGSDMKLHQFYMFLTKVNALVTS